MQPNQVISQPSQVTSGGGTKHKRRRRVRTLKATYGRAYRKYNQMYGGAGEVVPEPKKEEPGLFTTLTNKLFGSKEDDAKKKAEEEEEAANKKKAEEAAAATATTAAAPLEGDGKSLIQKAEDAASGALATVEGKAAEIKDGIVKTTTDLKDRATIAASVLVPSTGDDGAKNAAAMDAVASNAAEKDAEDDDNKSVSSEGSSSSSSSGSSDSSGSESENEDGEPKNGDGDGAEEVAAAAATSSDDDSSLSEDKRRIKELEKKVEMLTTGPLAEAARAAKDAAAAVESAMESMKLAAIAANAASAAASAIAISVNSEKFTNSKANTTPTTTSPPQPSPEPVTKTPSSDDSADAPEGSTDASNAAGKEFTDAQSLLGKDEPSKEATGDTLRGLNAEELESEVSEAANNPDNKKGGKNRHKHRKSNHNGTRKH